jgi:hypothetical protein
MRHGARADLEGRGGMKAVDRQHDVAMQIWEGGAMRESAASATLVASCASRVDLRGRRHKRERESCRRQFGGPVCLCLVEGGYGAKVSLVGWNGAFGHGGLRIDS